MSTKTIPGLHPAPTQHAKLIAWVEEVAALTLNRVGRTQDAFLLEINNVNAVQGITYVADVPPLRAGR